GLAASWDLPPNGKVVLTISRKVPGGSEALAASNICPVSMALWVVFRHAVLMRCGQSAKSSRCLRERKLLNDMRDSIRNPVEISGALARAVNGKKGRLNRAALNYDSVLVLAAAALALAASCFAFQGSPRRLRFGRFGSSRSFMRSRMYPSTSSSIQPT